MRFPANLIPKNHKLRHWVLNSEGVRKIHICAVQAPNGDTVGIGHAICNPCDEYIRERGREIAQGRAIKDWFNTDTGIYGNEEIVIHGPVDVAGFLDRCN